MVLDARQQPFAKLKALANDITPKLRASVGALTCTLNTSIRQLQAADWQDPKSRARQAGGKREASGRR